LHNISNKKAIIIAVVMVICIVVLSYLLADAAQKNAQGADAAQESAQGAAARDIPVTTTGVAVPTSAPEQDDVDATSPAGLSYVGEKTDADVQTGQDYEAHVERLPLEGMIVGIDAGHQGRGNSEQEPMAPDSSEKKDKVTSGTSGVSTGTPEHELNLAVAGKLKSLLEERGAKVIMTRESSQVDISNKERAELMNSSGVDICIRIHANGGGASQSGAMMLVPEGHMPKDVEQASRKAGEIIFREYLTETGAKDLGVIPRGDMTGFNWSKVPVCLIEMGFMTNKAEDELMETDAYREKCALGLADGIEKYLRS
jgi:N-acetylmuramoyl-L-alanine amidase